MSRIITFSDRKPSGTFCQIKLDDGKRILISFTQTEIAILKLVLGGTIPAGTIFKHNINEFLDFFSVRIKQIGINGSLLKEVVDYILPCKNIEEVAKKLKGVVDGCLDVKIKAKVQQKLEKQVLNLFNIDKNNDSNETIIHEFGKILEKVSQDTILKYPAAVYPQSLLPYKKEEIKEAINEALQNVNDENMRETLKTSDVFLDGFIEDEEANKRNAEILKILSEIKN